MFATSTKEILNYFNKQDSKKHKQNNNYLTQYLKMLLKRRMMQCYLIFIYQSLAIYITSLSNYAVLIYLPIGMAATLIAVQGNRIIPAIIFSHFIVYITLGLSITTSWNNSIYDITIGYLASNVTNYVLKSDYQPFFYKLDYLKYLTLQIILSIFATCLYSYFINADFNKLYMFAMLLNSVVIVPGCVLNLLHQYDIDIREKQYISFCRIFLFFYVVGAFTVSLIYKYQLLDMSKIHLTALAVIYFITFNLLLLRAYSTKYTLIPKAKINL